MDTLDHASYAGRMDTKTINALGILQAAVDKADIAPATAAALTTVIRSACLAALDARPQPPAGSRAATQEPK